MYRNQRCDQRIQQAFTNFAAFTVQHGRIGHQVANIAHQHQAAAFERGVCAICGHISDVIVQASHKLAARFFDFLAQIAFHQSQPVAIGNDFVGRIHGGHAVFAIHNGRHRRLEPYIRNPGTVGASDRTAAININDQMQLVIFQNDRGRRRRITNIPHERFWDL